MMSSRPEAVPTGGVSDYRKIELVWPGKDFPSVPSQAADGAWTLNPVADEVELRGLTGLRTDGPPGAEIRGLLVEGQRADALAVLGRTHRGSVRLAYFDLPRLNIDDKEAEFRSFGDRRYATWLEVVRVHVDLVRPLLRRDAVVIIHVADGESALARLILDETLGPENAVASIVWQRSYAPRNMRGMREFTTTHDSLLVYGVDKDALPPVGLRTAPAGFSNPDDDPRKEWKAEHKGAATRRESTDFATYLPPYRWRVVKGELPPGIWRLSPMTGVLWGDRLERTGDYDFTVEVEDAAGAASRAALQIRVVDEGAPNGLCEVAWPFEPASEGRLEVVTTALPDGVVGQEYSAVVEARGGQPFAGPPKRPKEPRYWEFSKSRLIEAFARDQVDLGAKGDAIPRIKRYASELGEEAIVNQTTWWPGRQRDGSKSVVFAGYTQDATRHLAALKSAGAISATSGSSKPEPLLARLLDIFTDRGDLVLEVFGDTGDLAATAMKRDRQFLELRGTDHRSQQFTQECVLPRLRLVSAGAERAALVDHDVKPGTWLNAETVGAFVSARVGKCLVTRTPGDDMLRIHRDLDDEELREAVLTSSGFSSVGGPLLRRLHGPGLAAYVGPDQFLTQTLLADLVALASDEQESLTVFYFRASEDLSSIEYESTAVCRRVPYQLGL